MGQILRGRPAAKGVNFTRWNEYQLCKEFGWTPSQLRNELAEDIELFLQFRNEEIKAEKARQSRRQ